MAYLWFKAFHIVGFVTWFAGLFYLVRLFIYHVEANEQPEAARAILKKQYEIMEKRLLNIITTPGMVLTVAMAVGMLVVQPDWLKAGWLHIKLTLVVLLMGYHFYCMRLRTQLAAGTCRWGPKQLRALNEAPTILLVTIVLLAVFKNDLPTDATAWIVFGLVISFAVTIQLYARKRRLDKEKQLASQGGQQ
ncbi:protoporphyrinogen oxidase HemJ [Gloeobacter violaceus]|uniref:Protoporphyrinogen IX oxidase n=1 Tax=Gloeobacter violaceus (strain ATCC 29082 / PCC 7421) TaxID=251221 RepID=Q7NCD9_GLOVI|nr:protoporphyrinogen oxidase HemJ [Gloeobacter violaceus]BAC90981.1 gll3040 [Gloeobacter violaceus PCC 7421]